MAANVIDIPTATLQQWYTAARAAYQALLTGQQVVEVMVDGYMTRFQRADAEKLKAYIAELKAEITGRNRPSGIGIIF